MLRSREDSDERAPQPGLAALDELLERVRVTGLNVKLSTEGDAVPLSSGLELSAYRIVQEALSNTLRHAQASEARVTVRYLPSSLALEVSDDGIGAAGNGSASGGHGLEGMRERVALFGGTLTAGPNPGRGFRVHAELPL